jgi:hypothetical protein
MAAGAGLQRAPVTRKAVAGPGCPVRQVLALLALMVALMAAMLMLALLIPTSAVALVVVDIVGLQARRLAAMRFSEALVEPVAAV